MTEQELIERLTQAFPFLQGKVTSPAPQRVFTDFLPPEEFMQIIPFVHDALDFYRALHVVGTDEGDDIGFSYLFSGIDQIILVVREKAPKALPAVTSICDLYPGMLMHELEMVDLFGAQISNLPDSPSYPLPDGWPVGQYPMRKEWNPAYFNKQTMQYEPPAANGQPGKEASHE